MQTSKLIQYIVVSIVFKGMAQHAGIARGPSPCILVFAMSVSFAMSRGVACIFGLLFYISSIILVR